MESRINVMEDVFQKLNERNKDMVILLAKSISVAQEDTLKGEESNEQKENPYTISKV